MVESRCFICGIEQDYDDFIISGGFLHCKECWDRIQERKRRKAIRMNKIEQQLRAETERSKRS